MFAKGTKMFSQIQFQYRSSFVHSATVCLLALLASSAVAQPGGGPGGSGGGGGSGGSGGSGSAGGVANSAIRNSEPNWSAGGTICSTSSSQGGNQENTELPRGYCLETVPCDGEVPPDIDCTSMAGTNCGTTTTVCRPSVLPPSGPCLNPVSPCGGGVGGGCSSGQCGAGGLQVAPGGLWYRANQLNRLWLPNNRVSYSAFSPGYYHQFSSQLEVFPETGGTAISFFDVYAKTVYIFVDGLDGDTQDGEFHDLRNNHARKLELLNGSGGVVSDPTLATKALVTHWNGAKEEFELVDMDPDPVDQHFAGRLSKRTSRIGEELDINYKTFTQAEIDASPGRQFQIDVVDDHRGSTLTFDYNASEQGGHWAVSKVTRNDGVDMDFAYANDSLTTITFADGSQATFAYGQDSFTQTATMTSFDPAQGREVVYYLTNDYMTLDESGTSMVINQPTGVYRMIANQEDELEFTVIPHSDPNVDQRFMHLGGNYAIVRSGDGTTQEWTVWGPAGFGIQPTFEGIDGTLDSNVIGPDAGTTVAQLYSGQIPGRKTNTGQHVTLEYDTSGNVSKITYPADGSFAEYTHNDFGQVTRYRSREGRVTKNTYDSVGNLLTTEKGFEDQSGQDVQTSAYSKWTYEYYAAGHNNAHMLKAAKDPLYNALFTDLHVTNYEYDANNYPSKIIGPADIAGGVRPETIFGYLPNGLLSSVTDPCSRVTAYQYDAACRLEETTYPDLSTEQTVFETSGPFAGLRTKSKDRVGTVTTYEYDDAGRLIKMTAGAAIDADILDGSPDDTIVTDVNLHNVMEYSFLAGAQSAQTQTKSNGAKTDYEYDYKNALTGTKQYPRVGVTLYAKKGFENEQLLYDEDPYGRRKYYGYRASDNTLIRTVTCTHPGYTLADFDAVWNLTRDNSPNAAYIIHDAIRDLDGNLTQVIDGRGTETRYEYDAQGRETKKTAAFGTTLAAISETDFDAAGNMIEVRSPRYFDSSDTEGYQKASETWTYNGSNKVLTHTEAPNSTVAATESYTYGCDGHQESHTDFGGNTWLTIDDSCCGKSTASKNPLGHGTLRNTDAAGRVVHTATVANVDSHTANMLNPVDAKTLAESTTKYDSLGRTVAVTTWLVALGQVDVDNPPIAGLGSVPAADGLTTQYLYDNNLGDGIGLDSGTGSTPALGGTAVSLSAAITKLADTTTNGGAGISFSADAPGSASVIINGEGEVAFSITDASGRSVMSGQLDSSNALLAWASQLADTVTSVAGFGDCLESQSIDALGNISKSLTDGARRRLRTIDQLGNTTISTFDAGGNQLSVRDPNNVGHDVTYDQLGREGLTTDTGGDTTNSTYDKAGNLVASVDGKGNTITYIYDARNRQDSQTDRIGAATSFTYLATGQLASLTDAENQTTSYSYDATGAKLTEQYPDHTGGTPGDSTYGIVTFTLDEAGRTLRKQDQNGDTVTYNYDLAGRLTSRDYRSCVNSPSGTIADTDSFTYDGASRMLTAISSRYNNTVSYSYDDAGRKATEALQISGQTYTTSFAYDSKGQLVEYTYPDGTKVDRTYTDRGQLHQLKYAGTTLDTRTYDGAGRMTASSYGNGVSESRTYNSDNTLASISYTGASIGDVSYSWDENKNKTAEAITGTSSGFGFSIPAGGYDAEDRLVSYNRTDGNLDQSWSLSSVGDWNSVTTEGTVQSRTHGPSHEILTADASAVSHDNKGNMTLIPASIRSSSSSLSLIWDMDNRLSSADTNDDGTADVTYKFDALGRRVFRDDGTTATIFIQSGQQTIADYTAGTAATSPTYNYVYSSYVDEPVFRDEVGGTGDVYFHRNQQYSITALTSSAGSIVERYAYSAYGAPMITDALGSTRTSSSENNRYTYTGREWDEELQLYHYRARMYEPVLGRFCSKDPIGYRDGKQLFSNYFLLSHTDPSGKGVLGLSVGNGDESEGIFGLDDANGDGSQGNPYDGDGSNQSLCNYVMFYLHLNAVGFNQTLLDHWLSGSGTPLTVDFDKFDSWGWERNATLAKFKTKLGDVGAKTACNKTSHAVHLLARPGSSNRSNFLVTPMIYGYRYWYWCRGKVTKKCTNGCDCSILQAEGWCRFSAEDHVNFWKKPTETFFLPLPIPGIHVKDRLIRACNPKGRGFRVHARDFIKFSEYASCGGNFWGTPAPGS